MNHSDEFYETQAQIENVRMYLEAAITEINDNPVLKDLKEYTEIALEEAKFMERNM